MIIPTIICPVYMYIVFDSQNLTFRPAQHSSLQLWESRTAMGIQVSQIYWDLHHHQNPYMWTQDTKLVYFLLHSQFVYQTHADCISVIKKNACLLNKTKQTNKKQITKTQTLIESRLMFETNTKTFQLHNNESNAVDSNDLSNY